MNKTLFSAVKSLIDRLIAGLTAGPANGESTAERQPVTGHQTFYFFDSKISFFKDQLP